jgi:hypothetical protein
MDFGIARGGSKSRQGILAVDHGKRRRGTRLVDADFRERIWRQCDQRAGIRPSGRDRGHDDESGSRVDTQLPAPLPPIC